MLAEAIALPGSELCDKRLVRRRFLVKFQYIGAHENDHMCVCVCVCVCVWCVVCVCVAFVIVCLVVSSSAAACSRLLWLLSEDTYTHTPAFSYQ